MSPKSSPNSVNAKEGVKNVVDNDMYVKLPKILNKLANKISFKLKGPNKVWVKENMSCLYLHGTCKKKKAIWILNSGYSRHMTGDKTLLSQFREETDI